MVLTSYQIIARSLKSNNITYICNTIIKIMISRKLTIFFRILSFNDNSMWKKNRKKDKATSNMFKYSNKRIY